MAARCPGKRVAQFFRERQRGQSGTAQFDEERRRIVIIRTREGKEVVVVHRDLDAIGLPLFRRATQCDEGARKQGYQKQKRGKARSRIDPVHELFPSSKKQEGPLKASLHCRRVCGFPHTGCGRRFVRITHGAAPTSCAGGPLWFSSTAPDPCGFKSEPRNINTSSFSVPCRRAPLQECRNTLLC